MKMHASMIQNKVFCNDTLIAIQSFILEIYLPTTTIVPFLFDQLFFRLSSDPSPLLFLDKLNPLPSYLYLRRLSIK